MPWRNLLFLKKRGARRTGTRTIGHWSELLLSLSLVIVGGGALALHVYRVMLPEWRASRELRGFEPGVCQITGTEVRPRDMPLAVAEFAVDIEASRITDEGLLPPVWIDLGFRGFTPTRVDAEHLARWYKVGEEHPCWYDPLDASRLYLRRPYRWWPLLVALMPASLFAVGVWGIVASLMQVATSAERRSLVAVKAARLDPLRDSPSESATLPALGEQSPGPGVRLAHRLPVASATAWRTLGLFFVCTIWNALLAYFGYVASGQFSRGDPPWLALGLVVLLGLVGVWLAFHLVRELWERRGIGVTQIEISDHPLALGGEYQAHLLQTGKMELRTLSVHLVSEEVASYQQGTDSRTLVETVYDQEIQSWRGLALVPGEPFEAQWSFSIPETAMHTFRSPHNEVQWLIIVQGITSRGQKLARRFPLSVPPPTTSPSRTELLAAGELAQTAVGTPEANV
ncbi:MAG: hypothetical protein ACR2NU_11120 [Aeoliella sp.]